MCKPPPPRPLVPDYRIGWVAIVPLVAIALYHLLPAALWVVAVLAEWMSP